MSDSDKIVIAGSGGIGRAVGLLLREIGERPVDLFLGDAVLERAQEAAAWVRDRSIVAHRVEAFHLPAEGENDGFRRVLEASGLLLDCLPGKEAPRMARLAREHGLHYANLTEHVRETEEIYAIARSAPTGFVVQAGLAPGFIDVLAHGLFRRFCHHFGVERAARLGLRTGALAELATPPHYYGFTWSPIGVATEYLEPCRAVREHRVVELPALSEVEGIYLQGVAYEQGLTSGGVADLPEALRHQVRDLDYKTLRYPGHYAWVQSQVPDTGTAAERAAQLEARMRAAIPQVESDLVVLYAFVEGHDGDGHLRRAEVYRLLRPVEIGGRTLRAIQSTTAAGMAEAARLLATGRYQGLVRQSDIDPEDFLAGPFVDRIYRSRGILDESGLRGGGKEHP
jgi:saccharopine dehydrogenase-like NADP-dependent oxidoreductase